MNKETQTIQLKDGRTLAFAEYGAEDGTPTLYFTGGNSSRLEGAWFDVAATAHNVRLISTDRPGYGLSDFQPNRTLLDWPDDVAQLADRLGITQFGVFGLSAGGPHVAAVAYKMPERLTAATIVSGASPYGIFDGMWAPIRLMYFLAHRMPFWVNVYVQRLLNDPDNVIKNKDRMAPPDAAILTNRPEVGQMFRTSQIESMRNGTEGAAQEIKLFTQPWDFALTDVTFPIALWYGEDDVNTPPAMGHFMHRSLPNSTLKLIPNEAHFSLINNHIDAILASLLSVS